jgi:hypothetical protein
MSDDQLREKIEEIINDRVSEYYGSIVGADNAAREILLLLKPKTMSDDELFIRDVPDWAREMRRHDTPFLTTLGYKHVKVGEQDEFGRTLLGYTEIDQDRKIFCTHEAAYFRGELYDAYKLGRFELIETEDNEGDIEERWEPIETDETRHLASEARRYAAEARDIYPRPIWDRELTDEEKRPKKLTWGMRF